LVLRDAYQLSLENVEPISDAAIAEMMKNMEDNDNNNDDDDDYGQPRNASHASAEASGLGSSDACHWIINTERIKLGEVLGEGSYGKVAEGQYFGTPVAVKRLFNSRLDDAGMRRMRREAAILSNLDHPRVVKLIGLALADDAGHHHLQLVMELVPRGSLRGVLSNGSISDRSLPWAKRLSMLRDAALGLEFLHGNGVLHRDIKSSNFLVDDDWSVKVGDFGFATAKQDNATMTRCGTPCWTAPEILCPPLPTTSSSSADPPKANYTEAADVYRSAHEQHTAHAHRTHRTHRTR
jgi:serine/threonine protein kinase